MKLFRFIYQDINFELYGSSWSGLECLLVDGEEVSRKRNFRFEGSHQFSCSQFGDLLLTFKISFKNKNITYQLKQGDILLVDAAADLILPLSTKKQTNNENKKISDNELLEKETEASKDQHFVSLAGLFLKLFKSVKVVKIALAGAAVSSWAILFSWEFALVIIGVIIFHEYGHLYAMKKSNLPTKGMYLIPFVGGVAVGDKPKNQWQEVYISMMGPVFGLAMTVIFYIIYLLTDNHFVGLVASVSAFVNIFNLLPIYPLDGGHVIKAIIFSAKNNFWYVGLVFLSALSLYFCWLFGLSFLMFFIIIGVVDLLANWENFSRQNKESLDTYGILFCLAWYFLTIIVFLVVIYWIAASGLPGSEIITKVLES